MKYRFIIPTIIIISFFLGGSALAQTAEPATVSIDSLDSVEEAILAEELETYDGIEVETIDKEPSRFGIFFRNIRDFISIGLTADPIKKAEKRLQVAEWRNQVAQKILESGGDEKVEQRAKKLLESSSGLIRKVEESKDKWAEIGGEKAEKLIKNIATHSLRKERVLDRIEEKIPEARLEQFQDIRNRATEQSRRLETALGNVNIPDEVKLKLMQIKDMIEAKASNREAFKAERDTLLEARKNGDESASEKLQNLREERSVKLDEYDERREENKERIRQVAEDLKMKADAGDEEAMKRLEVIENRVRIDRPVSSISPEDSSLQPTQDRKPEIKPNPTRMEPRADIKERMEDRVTPPERPVTREEVRERVEARVESRPTEAGRDRPIPSRP
jgi:hypothetical protein